MTTENTSTKAKKAQTEASQAEVVEPKKSPIIPKDIDMNQYVTVRNGFQGTLVYESPRTHEVFIWEGFGTEQEIELRELKNAKSSNKRFFQNNWFMFDESWIVDYLGVRQFYQNALPIDSFDDLFTKSPKEIANTIKMLSDGQKRSVLYRAAQLVKAGEIDSRKVIETLEDSLGVKLIEQ